MNNGVSMSLTGSAIDWLQEYAPGFQALSDAERQIITEFSFLWSLFEAKALNENGSASAIVASSARWARGGLLTTETFGKELAYFRNRYVANSQFTYHFDHLHLRANDAPRLVVKVLKGEDATPESIAAGVLIIVYRFRNNLFHGLKWAYELQGQFENFMHVNTALIRALELHNDSCSGARA